MTAHIIRLRGFWASAPLEGGGVRYARPFNWPRPLPAGEALWAVVTVAAVARVVFNGVLVGDVGPGGAAVRLPPLPARNELAVETAGELGEVWLEVRAG